MAIVNQNPEPLLSVIQAMTYAQVSLDNITDCSCLMCGNVNATTIGYTLCNTVCSDE